MITLQTTGHYLLHMKLLAWSAHGDHTSGRTLGLSSSYQEITREVLKGPWQVHNRDTKLLEPHGVMGLPIPRQTLKKFTISGALVAYAHLLRSTSNVWSLWCNHYVFQWKIKLVIAHKQGDYLYNLFSLGD